MPLACFMACAFQTALGACSVSQPGCTHQRNSRFDCVFRSLTETQRLQAVIQHPSYKADPLAAIVHHLQATLPPPAKQRAAAGGLGGKQGCKRHGGKQRRQQGGGASMQTD